MNSWCNQLLVFTLMLSRQLHFMKFNYLFACQFWLNLFIHFFSYLINTAGQTCRRSTPSIASCLKVHWHVLNFAGLWLFPMMQCCRNVPSCVRNAAGGGYRMVSVSNSFFLPPISIGLYASEISKMPPFCGLCCASTRKRSFTVSHSCFLVIMTFVS